MKEICIKHNPYKVETEIKIDGKEVEQNSGLNFEDMRFQEWVEELPKLLVEECNTRELKIKFHGTTLDYEDLLLAVDEVKKEGLADISLEHIPAKEVEDKLSLIESLFREIKKGPFEELKQEDLKRAFELASKSEFEVNVVATMSSGKSTLINSLLGRRLMPAKNEACTATISRIKDTGEEYFVGKAYNRSNEIIEFSEELDYISMERLNSSPEVSLIDIEGNIPFVNSKEMSLVLVDTPGPNNSRDESHQERTFKTLSESSKALVLYVLNATQLAVNDDNRLLSHVAESMSIGGKQSKDRFMFVVNKMDTFRKGEDDVEVAIKKVKNYLEDKGIQNPNIFPAAALPALDIRTYLNEGDKMDEDLEYEIEGVTRKLIKNDQLHLERYAPLPASVRGKIAFELEEAKESGNKFTQALIHTGIRPIEESINMYVEKYASTAKIKNIVDTFEKRLQTAKSFEYSKKEIAENREKHKEISDQIQRIKGKIEDGKEAKKFEDEIEGIDYFKEFGCEITSEIKKITEKLSEISEQSKGKFSKTEAENKQYELTKFAREIQTEIKVKLENIISSKLKNNVSKLVDGYKEKLNSLTGEMDNVEIEIDPFDLVAGDIEFLKNSQKLIEDLTQTERVKVGEKWVENTSKKWYKPWTWLQDSGYYKDVYEDKEYVDGEALVNKFLVPIQVSIHENKDQASKYLKEQTAEIKLIFKEEMKKIDNKLKEKLSELQCCANDKNSLEKIIKDSEEKLKWLEQIQNKMNNILEI